MLGEELRPGLWRWTAHHEEWKKEVASFAVEAGRDLVLIDPLLAGDQWGQLEEAATDRQLHVLLTIHWHARSAAEIAGRFDGSRIWAHSRNRAAVARRTPVTDVFRSGEELPAGLGVLEARPRSEVLFWEPRTKALIADLRGSLAPALDLPVELVLPSHGAPVLKGAKEALQRVASGASHSD